MTKERLTSEREEEIRHHIAQSPNCPDCHIENCWDCVKIATVDLLAEIDRIRSIIFDPRFAEAIDIKRRMDMSCQITSRDVAEQACLALGGSFLFTVVASEDDNGDNDISVVGNGTLKASETIFFLWRVIVGLVPKAVNHPVLKGGAWNGGTNVRVD